MLLAWTSEALYTGGADTSVSITCTFFLCMTLFQEAQAKGQAEIDRVIGHDVLPTFADKDRLPYIDAIIKEILRWGTVAPQALPHATSADDEYKGYFIPKGMCACTALTMLTYGTRHNHHPERLGLHARSQDLL
jgi:cytochrome P450